MYYGLVGHVNTWILLFKYWAIIIIIGINEVEGHGLIYVLKQPPWQL